MYKKRKYRSSVHKKTHIGDNAWCYVFLLVITDVYVKTCVYCVGLGNIASPHSGQIGLVPTSFTNLSHHRLPSSLRTDSTDFTTGPFLLSISVFFGFSFFIILFCSVPCGRLSWLLVSFWAHVNIVHRIVS